MVTRLKGSDNWNKNYCAGNADVHDLWNDDLWGW